jgi:hypothetical protein
MLVTLLYLVLYNTTVGGGWRSLAQLLTVKTRRSLVVRAPALVQYCGHAGRHPILEPGRLYAQQKCIIYVSFCRVRFSEMPIASDKYCVPLTMKMRNLGKTRNMYFN